MILWIPEMICIAKALGPSVMLVRRFFTCAPLHRIGPVQVDIVFASDDELLEGEVEGDIFMDTLSDGNTGRILDFDLRRRSMEIAPMPFRF